MCLHSSPLPKSHSWEDAKESKNIYLKQNTYVKSKVEKVIASLMAQTAKSLPAMCETQVQSLGQEDPLEEEMAPTPVFLPGKSHGQMSLVGYSP